MPLFIKDKAYKFFNHHNSELINRIVNHRVNVYKVSVSETDTNIYHEHTNSGMKYHDPVMTHALIQLEPEAYDIVDNRLGVDKNQVSTFFFQREYLNVLDLILDVGDILEWNETYWHVDEVLESKLIHSVPGYKFATVCRCHMTERSELNLGEVRWGSDNETDAEIIKNL